MYGQVLTMTHGSKAQVYYHMAKIYHIHLKECNLAMEYYTKSIAQQQQQQQQDDTLFLVRIELYGNIL